MSKIVDFNDYRKDMIQKEIDAGAKEFQLLWVAQISDDIDKKLDLLEEKYADNPESLLVALAEIREYLNLKLSEDRPYRNLDDIKD